MTEIICIIGRGRVGTALAAAWTAAGMRVVGPLGRGEQFPADATIAVLAVPDEAIPAAARGVPAGVLVAHCAASVPLAALGEREGFSMHPLLAVTGADTSFTGAGCAVAGTTPGAAAVGQRLARALGMRVVEVREEDRPLYHAAASLASNYLVTLEGEAERLMSQVGLDRAMLLPLVRAAVEAWGERGAAAALTGPIARGDEETVRRQRAAVGERAPDLLPMWDALADRTRALARSRGAATQDARATTA